MNSLHLLKSLRIFILVVFLLVVVPTTSAQETGHVISRIAWKPDGSVLAVAYADGALEIRNALDGSLEQELAGHSEFIAALAWHPTANQLISGSDFGAFLWDLSFSQSFDFRSVVRYRDFRCGTWDAATSHILLSADTCLVVWDAQTFPPQLLSDGCHDVPIDDISWNPDRSQVATSVMGNVILRDPLTFEWENIIDNGGFGAVAWSQDGQWLAAGDWLGGVRVWNIVKGEFQNEHIVQRALVQEPDTPFTSIVALQFSPDRTKLSSIVGTGLFTYREVDTGKLIKRIQLTTTPIFDAAFSPDGSKLAYGGDDGTLEIVDLDTLINNAGAVSAARPPLALTHFGRLANISWMYPSGSANMAVRWPQGIVSGA